MTKRRMTYLSAFALIIVVFALISQSLWTIHSDRVSAEAERIAAEEAQNQQEQEALAAFQVLQDKLINQSWGAENMKVVFLTFDGGPGDSSNEVLDILKRNNVKATFFTDGEVTEASTPIYQRIVSEGHSLANQVDGSYEGGAFMDGIASRIVTDEKVSGSEPVKVFRFIGGSDTADQESIDALTKAGYSYFDWNVQIPEGSEVDKDQAFKEIIDGVHGHSVSVVSLSSEYPAETGSREALESAIKQLQSEGYRFMTLDPVYSFVRFADPSGASASGSTGSSPEAGQTEGEGSADGLNPNMVEDADGTTEDNDSTGADDGSDDSGSEQTSDETE